jgi:hypothetical protein
MKKIFSLLFLCGCLFNSFGQSVGVGTSTPSATLEVKKSGKSTVKISSNGILDTAQLIFNNRTLANVGTTMQISSNREEGLRFSSSSDLPANTNDTIMQITPQGNVGIRTVVPQFPLDVTGDINLRGNLRLAGIAGLPGTVLSIKQNGSPIWTTPTVTITDTMTIPAYAFSAEGASNLWYIDPSVNYGYITATQSVFLYASLILPGGSQIKEIRAYEYDASSSDDIVLTFKSYDLGQFTDQNVTQIATTSFSSAIRQVVWTPSVPFPINNSNKYYAFRLRTLSGVWPGNNTMGFQAVRIIYTYTN